MSTCGLDLQHPFIQSFLFVQYVWFLIFAVHHIQFIEKVNFKEDDDVEEEEEDEEEDEEEQGMSLLR